jgi:hypothetical protein
MPIFLVVIQLKGEIASSASLYLCLEGKLQNYVALRYRIFVTATVEKLLAGSNPNSVERGKCGLYHRFDECMYRLMVLYMDYSAICNAATVIHIKCKLLIFKMIYIGSDLVAVSCLLRSYIVLSKNAKSFSLAK